MQYGFWSLAPPLVAITLALATRRILLPLAVGCLVAACVLSSGSIPSTEIATTSQSHWSVQIVKTFGATIWESFTDADHLKVLAFTLLLGGMVGAIDASGSLQRILLRLSGRIRTRSSAQTLIGLTGLAIFFDDYANTLLVGGTMRKTADRYGLSRAKLAYLVDSTAAPVAGLALVSTWVATELSYLESGLAAVGTVTDGTVFELFVSSIAYRFYPLLALVMVFVVARTGRDFGPMLVEEQKAADSLARRLPQTNIDSAVAANPNESGHEDVELRGNVSIRHWSDICTGIGPIMVCLSSVIATLVVTGRLALGTSQDAPANETVTSNLPGSSPGRDSFSQHAMDWVSYQGSVIGSGDSYLALVIGGLAGLLIATIAGTILIKKSWGTMALASLRGAWQMMPAMWVLWLAWALSALTGSDQLDTGGYLTGLLSGTIDPAWLPTAVFLVASLLAFATGTSWGTMAMLTPIAVEVALRMSVVDIDLTATALTSEELSTPLFLATFSSVLAGAILGDHCSPISDTTVLSSRACECDHMVHVRTQMPYAISVGFICIVLGTIPAGFGTPWPISLVLGGLACVLLVRLLGRQVSSPPTSHSSNAQTDLD